MLLYGGRICSIIFSSVAPFMEDTKKQITYIPLDLDAWYPYPGFQEQDDWLRYRRPIDDDVELDEWGG